jgi:hypothetical protein
MISLFEDSQTEDAQIDTRQVVIGCGVLNEIDAWVDAVAGPNAEVSIISDANTAVYVEQILSFFNKKPNHITAPVTTPKFAARYLGLSPV